MKSHLNGLTVIAVLSAVFLLIVCCGSRKAPIAIVKTPEGNVSFRGTVSPILEDQCTRCHGSRGGLSVESYEMLMKGGESGPCISPGDPNSSLLIQKIEQRQRPAIFHSLTNDRIKAIRTWIAEGAKEN